MDNSNNKDTIEESIHRTSTTLKDIAIIFGVIIGVLTFVITRPEFQALADKHDRFEESVGSTLKKLLTLQCKSARVNDKLSAKDVDEFCKQL